MKRKATTKKTRQLMPRKRARIRKDFLAALASSFYDSPINQGDLFLTRYEREAVLQVIEELVTEGKVSEITTPNGMPSRIDGERFQHLPHWWLSSRPMHVRGGALIVVRP